MRVEQAAVIGISIVALVIIVLAVLAIAFRSRQPKLCGGCGHFVIEHGDYGCERVLRGVMACPCVEKLSELQAIFGGK